jgi:hypothetical protein
MSIPCFGTDMVYYIYYHRVDTSDGGLLVPVGIIRPVFHASVLTWFIIYTIIGSIPLPMIVYIINHVSTEAWNTGRMIPTGTNSPPSEVSTL